MMNNYPFSQNWFNPDPYPGQIGNDWAGNTRGNTNNWFDPGAYSPGDPSTTPRNPMVDPYLKGDPQRWYFLNMPKNLSPNQKSFYDSNFDYVNSQYQKDIDSQAKQTGQMPTTQFSDWLGTFDWNNQYNQAKGLDSNRKYNFISPSLRWY
jgi:hypothetical protein